MRAVWGSKVRLGVNERVKRFVFWGEVERRAQGEDIKGRWGGDCLERVEKEKKNR